MIQESGISTAGFLWSTFPITIDIVIYSKGTFHIKGESDMPESTYKVIELVGSSENGFNEAVANAVAKASESIRDIRICEVHQLDCKIAENKITAYRARVKISFKYEGKE